MLENSRGFMNSAFFSRVAPWWMVGVLLFFYVLSILDRLILNMLIVPIQKELQFTDFQISLLIGPAFSICFGLFGYPLGWAADRFSRRRVIFGGLIVWSMATVFTGLSKTLPFLFSSRIGVGVGEAALSPAAYSLIADKFPKERLATAMSVFGMGPKVGTAVAFAVGGLVFTYSTKLDGITWPFIGALSSWRLALLMVGAPGILFAFLAFSFSEPQRSGERKKAKSDISVRTYISHNKPLFFTLLLGFSFSAIAASGLVSWVPTYLTREFGLSPNEYAPIMGVINLISASSIVVKGVVIDWLYSRGVRDAHVRFYTWMLAVTVPLSILAFNTSNPYIFMCVYGVVDVVLVSFLIYVGATIQMMVPQHMRGQITAIFMFLIMTLAAGVAPSLVASFTDFVFESEAALGKSLMLVTAGSSVVAFVMLRIALRYLKPRMEAIAADVIAVAPTPSSPDVRGAVATPHA
ncbi:MFS transporter [Cupriavidus basilensis]|uniref:MFS transporter n=1 Tax=Cupriavidus basilensis TaxID=68895 RepID=UPI00157AD913|nr:MFS transporter [Cupriavidus basilensis]NUA26918.1 MFS transporter [Cupriavidus basilensis]